MATIPEAFLKPAEISGWGMHVPSHVRTNRDFLPFTPYKRVSDIFRRSGIRERRVVGSGEGWGGLAPQGGPRPGFGPAGPASVARSAPPSSLSPPRRSRMPERRKMSDTRL